jgi:predicted nucleic acid-binding protein
LTRIYLDTSVVSALFDDRTPERLGQTKQAWELFPNYEVCISNLVRDELSNVKDELKEEFMDTIKGFTVLEVTDEVFELANVYVEKGIFPEKYLDDAIHVAIASLNNTGILLSWNFTHLVKIKTRHMVADVNNERYLLTIEIISPPEL